MSRDEDADFSAITAAAFSLGLPGLPEALPTGIVVEAPAEPDSRTVRPTGACPHEPPKGESRAWMKTSRYADLSGRVIVWSYPAEPGTNQYHAILIALETGDYVRYDERGRRIGSELCSEESAALLRSFAEQPGFKERVRELIAGR